MNEVIAFTFFDDQDIQSINNGVHYRLYEKLGSHLCEVEGRQGTYFAVWAPEAEQVTVMGDFNNWQKYTHRLRPRWDGSGIWEGFIPDACKGMIYKYFIITRKGYSIEKGDPYALYWEKPPLTGSLIWDTSYGWNDQQWLDERPGTQSRDKPMSVYEVHLGSWMRKTDKFEDFMSYREIAEALIPYVKELNFTHVEFLPVMEHPYYPSWGYQIHGYFAPSSRFGEPQDFMYLIDQLHQAGIGVILDWVPSHFPADGHGLGNFDGTCLYEHNDPQKGYHPDWDSLIFNYGRHEVRSFLISNAIFWLKNYHADGLRVDAVASMLYLNYSRNDGEWTPNRYGGNGNLDAIQFLKDLNTEIHKNLPGTITIAEESTTWPMVSHPVEKGGLGFDYKWMMGWMNDTLQFFKREAKHRRWHLGEITFSITYAFSEKFTLPFSHDEVVHGKASMFNKMPGWDHEKFANLRLLYAYMWTHPGSKLLFMGGEIAQTLEWRYEGSLPWQALEYPQNKGIHDLVKDLNIIYKTYPALFQNQYSPSGFEWVNLNDVENSVVIYKRKGYKPQNQMLVICNFGPNQIQDYRFGLPGKQQWQILLNSDDQKYGGNTASEAGGQPLTPQKITKHSKPFSLSIAIAPSSAIILIPAKRQTAKGK